MLIYLSPVLSLAETNAKPLNLEVDSDATKLSAEDWTLSFQVRVLDFSECLPSSLALLSNRIRLVHSLGEIVPVPGNM